MHVAEGSEAESAASHAVGAPRPRRGSPTADEPRELGSLAFGFGLLFLAAVVFWIGLYLPNHVALRTVAASFGTFGLVWLLFRLRIFTKPHGGLIAVGAVALFSAVVPFIERGLKKLDSVARAGLADEVADVAKQGVVPPPPVPTVDAPDPKMAAPPVDDVVRELIAPPADPALGRVIRMTQDSQVTIGGRKFLIRAGSQFPLKDFSEGRVTFSAGGQEVTIDAEMVRFIGQSQEKPEDIAKLAMDELRKRYPKVWEKGTHENEVFVERTRELKVELPDLFANPRWPLEIAEQLALQEGWKRADKNVEDEPEKLPNEPTEAATPPVPKGAPRPDEEQLAPK